ncbi:G-protein coupled receptor family C group 6 member A-like [Pleurodeles waltl]|uniref:G-protein coupled receptor family C group 6 member A-like n=1 Tax=Pleurodeles waltl TaxID=8319 RepID=UPI003709B87C
MSVFGSSHLTTEMKGDVLFFEGTKNEKCEVPSTDVSRFDMRSFIRSLAFIYTIETINKSPLLPNITLGYEVYDTCGAPVTGLQGAMRFMSTRNSSEGTLNVMCNYTEYIPSVKAVVGAGYSDVSITVAKTLSLHLIPQVSYASTAAILSDERRFPSFLRTVPSDIFQTKALARLINHFRWNWVGIIATQDEYGRSAMDSLSEHFDMESVCVEFKIIVPYEASLQTLNDSIRGTVSKIKKYSAKVVVLFVNSPIVNILLKEAVRQNVQRVWIASDVWSTSKVLDSVEELHKLGTILGFCFMRDNISGFTDYLRNPQPAPGAVNSFLEEYSAYNFTNDTLVKNIDLGGSYAAHLAVKAIAEALRNLLCANGTCNRHFNFPPWQPAFYPMILNHTQKYRNWFGIFIDFIVRPGDKIHQQDMRECKPCSKDTWPNREKSDCLNRTKSFLQWKDPFAILLTAFAAFGFLTVVAIAVLFLIHMNTPAVKAAGGIYSCVMNGSLLSSFVSTAFFMGEPNNYFCQTGQTLYGISFTLCVACVLLKSIRILLAFEMVDRLQANLKITYQPAIVIFVVTSLQVLICSVWLLYSPPLLKKIYTFPKVILLQCMEGSTVAFGVMLGYIAVLALICFGVAFRGRNLPGKYNEARFITFSMLIYLFVWIAFIPIYVTTVGVYLPAVQVVAILASSYGIICCHLLPTAYIIVFKRNSNNKSKYLQSIRTFYKLRRPVFSMRETKEATHFHSKGSQTNLQITHDKGIRKRCGSF